MKRNFSALLTGFCAFLAITVAFSGSSFAMKKRIVFGGGPAGGTFQVVGDVICQLRDGLIAVFRLFSYGLKGNPFEFLTESPS